MEVVWVGVLVELEVSRRLVAFPWSRESVPKVLITVFCLRRLAPIVF